MCLKILHKPQLMLVDILEGQVLLRRFLGVKAYGNPLHHAHIVYSTVLVEICQRNGAAFVVHLHRCNGRRDFLEQRQSLFPVGFVCKIDDFF